MITTNQSMAKDCGSNEDINAGFLIKRPIISDSTGNINATKSSNGAKPAVSNTLQGSFQLQRYTSTHIMRHYPVQMCILSTFSNKHALSSTVESVRNNHLFSTILACCFRTSPWIIELPIHVHRYTNAYSIEKVVYCLPLLHSFQQTY